jgi:hypothetical protein
VLTPNLVTLPSGSCPTRPIKCHGRCATSRPCILALALRAVLACAILEVIPWRALDMEISLCAPQHSMAALLSALLPHRSSPTHRRLYLKYMGFMVLSLAGHRRATARLTHGHLVNLDKAETVQRWIPYLDSHVRWFAASRKASLEMWRHAKQRGCAHITAGVAYKGHGVSFSD